MKNTSVPNLNSYRHTVRERNKIQPRKTPRTRKPEEMSLEEWQIALRREFGREQNFLLKNIGTEPIFSEYVVTNSATDGTYRVLIRGQKPGDNYCSCPDFSVNTLGTCKHIEFTLGKLESKHANLKVLEQGFHPSYSEVYLRYNAKRDVAFRAGAFVSPAFHAVIQRYFNPEGILKSDAYLHFEHFLKEAQSAGVDLRCYEEAINYVAQVRDEAKRREKIDKAFPEGADSTALKTLLKTSLYKYQREGALFLAKAGRSLLADEMGLGKTPQAIAGAEILSRTVGLERVLVVCPTSLKHQWKQEIEKFTKRSVEVIEGFLAIRARRYESSTFFKITNYDVIHRDLNLIHAWGPELIILDEAQRIKNWKTRTAQSVKKLRSEYAIVLTGTPLENRLEELHSIVQFVDRYHLGPLFRFLAQHQELDEYGKVVGYRNLSKISQTLKPVLLRRNKKEVLTQLPKRIDKNFFVPMTEQQMKHHDENRDVVARIVAKWRRHRFLLEADQRRLMIALQNMRMSCDSTYLLDQTTDFGVKADELMSLLSEMFECPETKVVVFSQWLRMHEILEGRLKPRGWKHVLFHGSVPSMKRRDLIQEFKSNPDCRVFLSTDAGGLGLNLQNACVVVNMDQPWNPAVLEQRIGRVHRLGQQRAIQVVNFVAQGTIEHGMLNLLRFKKSMFAGVLDGGENEVFLGGSRLNRFMETVESVSTGIPSSMPMGSDQDAGSVEKAKESMDEKKMSADVAALKQEDSLVGKPMTREEVWVKAISAGVSFLKRLGEDLSTSEHSSSGTTKCSRTGGICFSRDETTGEPYLKLPVPKPEVLKKIVDLLDALES